MMNISSKDAFERGGNTRGREEFLWDLRDLLHSREDVVLQLYSATITSKFFRHVGH